MRIVMYITINSNKGLFFMVRLVDIAKELNLNVSVVSRALNPNPDSNAVVKEETRELVRQTAKRLGYRPNRQASFLKKGGDATLLCYLPGAADRLVADLMFGISEAAAREGFPLIFFNGANSDDFCKFLEDALQTKHSGLITYPPHKMDKKAVDAFEKYLAGGGKVLMLNAVSNMPANTFLKEYENVVHLDIDDAYGSGLAIRKLAELGCKYIRYSTPAFKQRIQGMTDAAEALQIDCAELDWNELQELAGKNEKVGIFAFRDTAALNIVTRLLINKYKVGEDVLVIGFDDQVQCVWAEPSVSSIHQPTRQEGRRAVEKMINMIFGRKEKNETIKPYLVLRESTGSKRKDPTVETTENIVR